MVQLCKTRNPRSASDVCLLTTQGLHLSIFEPKRIVCDGFFLVVEFSVNILWDWVICTHNTSPMAQGLASWWNESLNIPIWEHEAGLKSFYQFETHAQGGSSFHWWHWKAGQSQSRDIAKSCAIAHSIFLFNYRTNDSLKSTHMLQYWNLKVVSVPPCHHALSWGMLGKVYLT